MTRLRGAGLVAAVVLGCLVAAEMLPGHRAQAFALAIVVTLGFGLVVTVRHTLASAETEPPGPGPRDGDDRDEVGRPEDLLRLERLLGWKTYSRLEFEHRAGPVMRRLAAYRLRAAGLADLEADPAAARRLLTPRLWEIVTSPGARRDYAAEERSPGGEAVTTGDIAAMLDELEGL